MIARALVATLLASAACGTSSPARAPVGHRGGAPSSPALAAVEPALADFLERVVRATEAHDWPALLALCSAEHRATQLDGMGQDRATYLAEILGLHFVDNTIGSGVGGAVTEADLATIARLEIVSIDTANGGAGVSGWVVLTSGLRLRLWLSVTPGPAYALTGAVG